LRLAQQDCDWRAQVLAIEPATLAGVVEACGCGQGVRDFSDVILAGPLLSLASRQWCFEVTRALR